MARRKKGTWGISDEKPKEIKKVLPEWSPPKSEDVFEGMTLVHVSPHGRFPLKVSSLQHGGAWVFGKSPDGSGPYAVPLNECMTLSQAAVLLHAENAAELAETS